jgi:hypothetical protein
MYRVVLMFPKSADPEQVDTLIEGIARSLKARENGQTITRNVGALMGPGAHAGEAGWILEADFPTLDDAMKAMDAEDFQQVKAAAEALTSSIFLFEIEEV